MRLANVFVVGVLLALGAPSILAQAKPSGQAAPKPVASPAKVSAQAAAPAAKAAAPTKPAAQGATKPSAVAPKTSVAKTAAPAKKKLAAKKPAKPVEKPEGLGEAPAESDTKVARRDPFESLVGRQQRQSSVPAIPGKPGLVIGTLRLDGIVKAPSGMIAVVTNPQSRTYFLREGDQLFDGRVEKITMDSVSFHELGKDAFGKPVERTVSKGIYSSPGEQQ
jgi:hypothetical protein